MQDDNITSYSSLLNLIKSKPLIIERIFSYSFSRPNILMILISKDKQLIDKLNEIFSKVSKYSSKLDEEFINNLKKYSKIREMINLLEEEYKKMPKNNIPYTDLKNKYQYSFINHLLNRIEKCLWRYNLNIFDDETIKGLIMGYISTLDSITLTFLPQRNNYLDGRYIFDIIQQNKNSKEKFKNNQKIKLLLLFDNNYFFNNIYYTIKLPNIEEIEIIFDNEFKDLYFKNNNLLHVYLNNYLSKIYHLNSITKINFHNLEYKDDLYQSVLGYLFDGYFSETNEDIIQQLRLLNNLKTINIEMTFLYIYEKIKLYFYIYELFPSLNIYSSNKNYISNVNFSYYLNNKILIINNSNAPLRTEILMNFIECMMNNNENIEFLFIVNNNKLIIDKNEEKNEKEKDNKKINISKLREFTFINEKNDDIKILLNNFMFNEGKTFYKYEGYDKDNNLIYYRFGETHIQSFDLIDLYKYNKNIERIEFIFEEITVIFTNERSNLQIIYKGKAKGDNIINNAYLLPFTIFSQFIKNQSKLTELTIKRFDLSFQDIINDNIKILNINYEKNIDTLEYKISDTEEKLNKFIPNLTTLNLGCEINNIKFLRKIEFTKEFKTANIILKYGRFNDLISKIKNKFKKHKKEINIEIIKPDKEEEEEEEEYENYEEEYENYEEDNYYKISDYL